MLLMLLLLGGYLFQIIFLSCYVGDQEGGWRGGGGIIESYQSGAFGGFVDLTYGSFRDLLTFVIC